KIVVFVNDPDLFPENWRKYLLYQLQEDTDFGEVPIKLKFRARAKVELTCTAMLTSEPLSAILGHRSKEPLWTSARFPGWCRLVTLRASACLYAQTLMSRLMDRRSPATRALSRRCRQSSGCWVRGRG